MRTMTSRFRGGWERAQEDKFDALKEEGLLKGGLPVHPDSIVRRGAQQSKGGKVAEETYECEAYCKRATAKALLCDIEGREHWIPKSQIIEAESEVNNQDDEGTLVMTQWIAEQKGLV